MPELSSFGPNQFGAQPAASGQNSFADFALTQPLSFPGDNGLKIATAYGPNFAYSDGVAPILVAFGDSSSRRFLFLPGEVMEGIVFQNCYIWAADAAGVGTQALVKWGAQKFRPSLRSLPGNPTTQGSTQLHALVVGEVGVTPSPEILPYSASRIRLEVTPCPLNQLMVDTAAAAAYIFGIGHTSLEAEENFSLGNEEVTMFSGFGALNGRVIPSAPYGYFSTIGGGVCCCPFAVLDGPGALYFCHNLPSNQFAFTPYSINFRATFKTY